LLIPEFISLHNFLRCARFHPKSHRAPCPWSMHTIQHAISWVLPLWRTCRRGMNYRIQLHTVHCQL
jgi:hypothetical protein